MVIAGLAATVACASALAQDLDYVSSIEAARAERVERLKREDGWLTLVGLHFLKEGSSTVGRARDNAIVLADGPEHWGTVTLAADGAVSFVSMSGEAVSVDDSHIMSGEPVRIDRAKGRPAVVRAGTVSFFVIERGVRKALRVRDSASPRRTHFAGIDYFPIDPTWRVDARWVPFESPREIAVPNVLGVVSHERVTGKLVFEREGRTHELIPLVDADDGSLFLIFSDTTSGEGTYGMRFLYAEAAKDGRVVLDFNLAINPPCAFTPFATCPLPPQGNGLATAVSAGEKQYRGSHDSSS
ncbi:MAG: DUF1684 domain-containing protein [Opitutaceae bacterium]|nr:DUF1684 domain-containing protein [Opitutaceae bacterium]